MTPPPRPEEERTPEQIIDDISMRFNFSTWGFAAKVDFRQSIIEAVKTERQKRMEVEKELTNLNFSLTQFQNTNRMIFRDKEKLEEQIASLTTQLKEAEGRLDKLSYAVTVVECRGCHLGYRNREMSDGFCAKCLTTQLLEATLAKDDAYLQRNFLVAALARVFPSGVRKTNIPGWEDDWHGCCFIDLPTGQISYHYHDSHAYLFEGLPPYEKEWDGHDKSTVHERLKNLKGGGE